MLFGVRCLVCVVCCLLFVVCCLLFVVWCLVFGVRCLFFKVWGLGFREGDLGEAARRGRLSRQTMLKMLMMAPAFGSGGLGNVFRVPCFGLRVSGFRFPISVQKARREDNVVAQLLREPDTVRVSGSGFQVPGFGFRVSGSGFRVPGSGFRIPGSGFRIPGFGFRVSGSWCRVRGVGFMGSGFMA